MQKFTLASIFVEGVPRPAVGLGNGYVRFSVQLEADYTSLKTVFQDWPRAFSRITTFVDQLDRTPGSSILAGAADLDMPVRFPNKIVGMGANFIDHLAEMGLPTIRYDPMPIFFMPPTTCMVGPGKTVIKPKTTQQFDWEIELAVVIGAKLKDVSREEASRGIAGYTILLDMSARDLIQIGPPFYVDLVRGKAQDTMAPCGPSVTPAAFIGDVRNLSMKLYVNDRLMQDSNTSNMIFQIDEIISHITRYVTLEPGDIVSTGAPAGSGVFHNYFLRGGDRIRAQIENVGELNVEIME
jgi:2-keto-4-pentenoate hydratase/2-oxohepta-3-ene-1,7-dioic acid hydratase in catechol pathway